MASTARTSVQFNEFQQLRFGREILRDEGQALIHLSDRLDASFHQAANLIHQCRGDVLISGIGKAGLIGAKLAATFCSTGTRAHFLHAAEAIHGDLGCVAAGDIVIMLSFSGETEEVVRLLPEIRKLDAALIAITGDRGNRLAAAADVVLPLGNLSEACHLGLAPTTSTTAMLGLGDALALVVSRMRQFGAEDFARFHPGGSLGRRLAKVEDVMRPLSDCRLAHERTPLRDVLVQASRPGRRTGAIMLTDDEGRLAGLITDSDLARLLERREDRRLDEPAVKSMTPAPTSVRAGTRFAEALELIAERKISELPIIDDRGLPVGLIDITDVLGLAADESTPARFARSPATQVTLPFRSPDACEPPL